MFFLTPLASVLPVGVRQTHLGLCVCVCVEQVRCMCFCEKGLKKSQMQRFRERDGNRTSKGKEETEIDRRQQRRSETKSCGQRDVR